MQAQLTNNTNYVSVVLLPRSMQPWKQDIWPMIAKYIEKLFPENKTPWYTVAQIIRRKDAAFGKLTWNDAGFARWTQSPGDSQPYEEKQFVRLQAAIPSLKECNRNKSAPIAYIDIRQPLTRPEIAEYSCVFQFSVPAKGGASANDFCSVVEGVSTYLSVAAVFVKKAKWYDPISMLEVAAFNVNDFPLPCATLEEATQEAAKNKWRKIDDFKSIVALFD